MIGTFHAEVCTMKAFVSAVLKMEERLILTPNKAMLVNVRLTHGAYKAKRDGGYDEGRSFLQWWKKQQDPIQYLFNTQVLLFIGLTNHGFKEP